MKTIQTRRGVVSKYATSDTPADEKAFHDAIVADPTDETNLLVYADWLEEHGGRPATAELIRRHVANNQNDKNRGMASSTGVSVHPYAKRRIGHIGFSHPAFDKDLVSVHLPLLGGEGGAYIQSWVPKTDSKRLVGQLRDEGYPFDRPTRSGGPGSDQAQYDNFFGGPEKMTRLGLTVKMVRCPPPHQPEPPGPEPLPPYGDDDRRLWVLNHEPLYRHWLSVRDTDGESDPLEDGYVHEYRDHIDAEVRRQPGMQNYPNRMTRRGLATKMASRSPPEPPPELEPEPEEEFPQDDEPAEDDYVTEDGRHWYQNHKLVVTVPEGEDHEPHLRAHAEAQQFWPNAWFVSDHGNSHPVTYSRTTRRKYAKVPKSESGVLTPEQLAIAKRAAETGDLTAWGALGDHLADNGYPNAGGVLSKVGSGHPGAREYTPIHTDVPDGGFDYHHYYDQGNVVHHLKITLPDGTRKTFVYAQPVKELMTRRKFGASTDAPLRYGAYRAPAGGIVARGTAYKGGETIPDMEGSFMNPPQQSVPPNPKRKPRRKGVTALRSGEVKKQESDPDTPPEGFGGRNSASLGTAPETVETPAGTDAGVKRRPARRFGRAPADEVTALAGRQMKHGGGQDPNNHSDMILADKLADHDDPLETVVRRDLTYRTGNASEFLSAVQRHLDELGWAGSPLPYVRGRSYSPVGGGSITVGHYGDDGNGNALAYRMHWHGPGSSSYVAAMTPAEAIHLLNEHGVHHDLKLPYGGRTEPEKMTRRKLRYGMLPKDEIKAFSIQGQEGGQYAPNNTADMVFADRLADADDPRELIVRRDLEHRGSDGEAFTFNHRAYHHRLAGGNSSPLGRRHPDYLDRRLPDGTAIAVRPWGFHDRYGNVEDAVPTSHEITWDTPYSIYYGAFSPEEKDRIMNGLGANETPEQMTRRGLAEKYATKTNWQHFQNVLETQPQHRWGGPNADPTLRGVAADAYEEETGDTEGANILRDRGRHVVVHNGRVEPAEFTARPIERAHTALEEAFLRGSRRNFRHNLFGADVVLGEHDPASFNNPLHPNHGLVALARGFDTPQNSNMPWEHDPEMHVSRLANHMADSAEHDWNAAPNTFKTTAGNQGVELALRNLRSAPYERPVPRESTTESEPTNLPSEPPPSRPPTPTPSVSKGPKPITLNDLTRPRRKSRREVVGYSSVHTDGG